MKKLLLLILLIPALVRAQYVPPGYAPKVNSYGQWNNRSHSDSAVHIPRKYAFVLNDNDTTPQIFVYNDTMYYYSRGNYYSGFGSGGTPSLTQHYIGYGSGSNTLTGSSGFQFDGTGKITIGTAALGVLSGDLYFTNSSSVPTAGNDNTFFGYFSGNNSLTGSDDAGFGYQVFHSLTSGNFNTGFGYLTLSGLTSGSQNLGFGQAVLSNITTGISNIALGYFAGNNFLSGSSNNLLFGVDSTNSSASVNNFTFIGNGYTSYRNNSANFGRADQVIRLGNGGGNTAVMNSLVTPSASDIFYNTDSAAYCFYNGAKWLRWYDYTLISGGAGLPSLANGKLWIGNGSNVATAVTPSGDWTVSNTGVATLTSTVGAGSCVSCNITFDAKGRATAFTTGGGGNPFADNVALVENSSDNTKLLKLSAASITTATTRTWTFPDVNGTVARNDAAQTFTGIQSFLSNPILNTSSTVGYVWTASGTGGQGGWAANAAITALTGDGTASGPGSAALTLATVNSNTGSYGDGVHIPQFTVNGKGLITAVTNFYIDSTKFATRYYLDHLIDTSHYAHGSGIWGSYVESDFETIYDKTFDPSFFKTRTDSVVTVDTSASLTHLATQAYALAHGGGGGGTIADSVQVYSSGTTLTQATLANIIQINPGTTQSTLTITTATTANWAASNDLIIVAGGTVTSGAVITTLSIIAGSGLTLVQAVTPTTISAGESIRYHKIGSLIYRIN